MALEKEDCNKAEIAAIAKAIEEMAACLCPTGTEDPAPCTVVSGTMEINFTDCDGKAQVQTLNVVNPDTSTATVAAVASTGDKGTFIEGFLWKSFDDGVTTTGTYKFGAFLSGLIALLLLLALGWFIIRTFTNFTEERAAKKASRRRKLRAAANPVVKKDPMEGIMNMMLMKSMMGNNNASAAPALLPDY